MSLGAVRQPRRHVRQSLRHTAQRGHQGHRVPARRRELRDVRHPLRPGLRVERVIVCPSGVHVVTSLALAGTGTGGEPASPAVVAASRTAADLVAALLPQRYRDRVRPVLCREDDVAMAELVDGVLMTAPGTLEHILASSPVVLSTSEVNEVATCLDARMEAFPMPPPPRRRRWGLRRKLLSVAAASSGVAVLVLAHGVVGVPLP